MGLERLREELQRTGIPVEHLAPEKKRVYLVGGCIRDALLGRHIVDFDFVVEDSGINYAEDLARKVGGRFVPLKLDEGRVVYKRSLVLDFSGLGTRKIEDDLRDRDFTINAMAIELQDLLHARWRILDPCSGMEDLSSKVIRTVAEDSLVKDPVRLLRAFRFASELDFVIEGNTMNALKLHRDLIRGVAGERISYELRLILQNDASWKQVDEMGEVSLLVTLFPELREMDTLLPEIELLTHSIASLRELEGLLSGTQAGIEKLKPWSTSYFDRKNHKPLLKLATLLHDIGKPNSLSSDKKGRVHFYGHDMLGEKLLHPILKERLRLSNAEVETITRLVRYHMRPHLLGREEELSPRAMRRFFADLEEEWVGVLLLAYADALASENGDVSNLESLITQLVEFKEETEKKGKVERLIDGNDLIGELQLEPGPIFRKILERVEEEQLEGKVRTKKEALQLVREMLKQGEG